jgi:TetR/AcrR family transcriptional repressor of nem operon
MKNSREIIIDTAGKLFLQKGYRAVTMQDIVKGSGLSKGAFYHYFTSKESVLEEVMRSDFSVSIVQTYGDLSTDSLKIFYNGFIKKILKRVDQYQVLTGDQTGTYRANRYALMFDALKILPDLRERQQQNRQQELDIWSEVIRKAKASGEIREDAGEDIELAKLFVIVNYGIGSYFVLGNQVDEMSQEIQKKFNMIYA